MGMFAGQTTCNQAGARHTSPHRTSLHMPLQEELSEDVKVALAGALGAWLPRCAGMPEPALARLAGERAAGAYRHWQATACCRACNTFDKVAACAAVRAAPAAPHV